MVDGALQRKNMVDSQVRPRDVTDRRILKAMLDIPREPFVHQGSRALAYMDDAVPMDASSGRRQLMAAATFARLVQLADIAPGDRVLDVASGSGYGAAVLAQLATSVVAVEGDAALVESSRINLESLGLSGRVRVIEGDPRAGVPKHAPFEVVVFEGSIGALPAGFGQQLSDEGRIVAVVRDGHLDHATIWRKRAGGLDQRASFEAPAPLLAGFEQVDGFAL